MGDIIMASSEFAPEARAPGGGWRCFGVPGPLRDNFLRVSSMECVYLQGIFVRVARQVWKRSKDLAVACKEALSDIVASFCARTT